MINEIPLCVICSNKRERIAYSERGVISNLYYDKADQFKYFPFGVFVCPSCCSIETICSALGDSELFENYAYRSPATEFYEEICDFFNPYLLDLPDNVSICEVGGNNGLFIHQLAENFKPSRSWEITMIDPIYPNLLNHGNMVHVPKMLTAETLKKYKLEEKFDFVIARHCLAHNEDLITLWENVARLIAPDGLLYVEVADLEKITSNMDFGQFYPEHRYSLSLTSIQKILVKLKLHICEVVHPTIHNGSLGIFISRKSNVSKFSSEFVLDPLALKCNFENWLAKIARHLDEYSEVCLWGVSAKSVFVLNLLGSQYLNKFVEVIDSTPVKVGKFAAGLSTPCVSEHNFSGKFPVLIGAPNYWDIIASKVNAAEGSLIGSYDFSRTS